MKELGLLVLFTATVSTSLYGVEWVFNTPSDDRWHYPFNFTPGQRAFATCFGSTADPNYTTFNDRDGIFLIGWRTSNLVCPALPPGSYDVQSVRVTLTAPQWADWTLDLTTDPWFNLDYPITDSDPGQPIELFGVGFGPIYTYGNWTESSSYVGGDDQEYSPRDPFPFVFGGSATSRLHVEDSVKEQFTPTPWAIGVPIGAVPGEQTAPLPVQFDIDLLQSDGLVRRYFQEQLSGGRVLVAVTALTVTSKQAPAGFPAFYTKEGAAADPAGRAPVLSVTLVPSGDLNGSESRDLSDWKVLTACNSGPDMLPFPPAPLTTAICLCVFDLDEDGDVDLQDAELFARRFGGNE